MTEWLRKTHGPTFELLRHFLGTFFESDFITTSSSTKGVLIGMVPVFFQWFFLLIGPLRHKYEDLSRLVSPNLYRESLRADELWLITLMMCAVGLLTATKWQSLFPDGRDYRALGTLPLRPVRIFAAKFGALLIVATAALIVLNFLPCFAFPALSGGRWAYQSRLGDRLLTHAATTLAGSAFAFFALVALQGLLLNILRPRAFGRVAAYCQGVLVAVMLAGMILSFSIQPRIMIAVTQSPWKNWLPPVWFLGLFQTLSGDGEAHALADRGVMALWISIAAAVLTYVASYQRHRTLLMEAMTERASESRWTRILTKLLTHTPRKQAVADFMLETMLRSRHHRMMLMAYGGVGFALLLTGTSAIGRVAEPTTVLRANFVYYHMLVLLFLLIGARHVFSLPTVVKANWIFQITEADGRMEWFSAMDLFVYSSGALLLAAPAPVEIWLFGVQGAAETLLFAALGLLAYEFAFASWDKLPFTCSYLPGKIPTWMILAFFGFLGVLTLVHAMIMTVLSMPWLFIAALGGTIGAWWRKRATRLDVRAQVRLCYEDAPEPVVKSLGLMR